MRGFTSPTQGIPQLVNALNDACYTCGLSFKKVYNIWKLVWAQYSLLNKQFLLTTEGTMQAVTTEGMMQATEGTMQAVTTEGTTQAVTTEGTT